MNAGGRRRSWEMQDRGCLGGRVQIDVPMLYRIENRDVRARLDPRLRRDNLGLYASAPLGVAKDLSTAFTPAQGPIGQFLRELLHQIGGKRNSGDGAHGDSAGMRTDKSSLLGPISALGEGKCGPRQ